jgi:hypothetical protein
MEEDEGEGGRGDGGGEVKFEKEDEVRWRRRTVESGGRGR